MCCPGCQAVAETIVGQGLGAYYERRDAPGTSPAERIPESLAELRIFDDPRVQQGFVSETGDSEGDTRRASLAIEGITCAACAWLIERNLGRQPGVREVSVNLTSHRAQLTWDAAQTPLSALLECVSEIGYRARPYEPDRQEALLRGEERRALRRLGVAGLGMMQVMTFAVALYAGALEGMEDRYRDFLRWVSLLVATPIVLYAARPFFAGAVRDLRARQPGMDLPVAIAIGAAYLASAWATVMRTGEVYFDSVCMFTFFLGLGRYLEMRVRHRSDTQARRMLSRLPQTARRLVGGEEEMVPTRALETGDLVVVRPGETIPADGVVREGASSVSEALLTGEDFPRTRGAGERVIGGSQNIESPIVVEVTRSGANSTLATILALLDRAQAEKPPVARLADRVAHYFVAGVLVIAAGVGLAWYFVAPDQAFWVVLSLLVVTCPCALSLATPAALAAATNGLAASGLLVTRGHTLEGLARATHMVFDKTGTLTRGEIRLSEIRPLRALSQQELLAVASWLEHRSEHPIARAFAVEGETPGQALSAEATSPHSLPGHGVEGELRGVRHRLGAPAWAIELCPDLPPPTVPGPEGRWILLTDDAGPLAWFGLRDELRADAPAVVEELGELGIEVELLSGDASPSVTRLAGELGIAHAIAGATPEQKVEHVSRLQREGALAVMVGDGINDAPVLARAQISIAMGGGSDLARISADAVLLGDHLGVLSDAVRLARKTRRIVRQNLAWALLYNATVLPLAALGYIAPYMAAIGMSASSLLVVANALRLGEVRSRS